MSSTVHSMYCEFGEQGLGYIIIQIRDAGFSNSAWDCK